MAQMLLCKGHDLERSRSKIKLNGTIGFLDLKTILLDTKIVILSALVQKLWSTTSFCTIVANITHLRTPHAQIV